jgi:hypothetical protein
LAISPRADFRGHSGSTTVDHGALALGPVPAFGTLTRTSARLQRLSAILKIKITENSIDIHIKRWSRFDVRKRFGRPNAANRAILARTEPRGRASSPRLNAHNDSFPLFDRGRGVLERTTFRMLPRAAGSHGFENTGPETFGADFCTAATVTATGGSAAVFTGH